MQSPPLSILDSGFYNKGCEDYNYDYDYDAHHPYRARSRAGTNASRTTDLKRNYFDSPQSLPLSSPSLTSQSASSVSSSISYLSPLPSNYLPTPIPRTFSPFPGLSPEILGGEWSEPDSTVGEPAHVRKSSNASLASVSAAAMSSAALGITSAFPMGDKGNFWPGMMPGSSDNSNAFLGHDLAMAGAGAGSDFTAGGSRSLTSSPRQGMTAEQREIKRQMDQARRESKSITRFKRSGSSPYLSSAEPTPGLNMPVYTTSMAPISLLAEPATSIPQPGYLSAPYGQPLEPDTTGLSTPSMYSTAVPQHHQPQPMQSTYNVPVEFPSAFQQQHAPSYGRARPASITGGSDPSLLYPIPPVLTPNHHHHQHQHQHQHPHQQHHPHHQHQHQHQQAVEAAGHVRVLQSRPKPQCWEHGCNGRQFSTFSNLLRHQREKSGQASKATCPNCGAEFTRTTARNGHLLQGKCKRRGTSGDEGGMPLMRTPSTSSLADGGERSPMPDGEAS